MRSPLKETSAGSLSDSQWRAIAKAGSLPDELRDRIELAISAFQLSQKDPPRKAILRSLKKIEKKSDELLALLDFERMPLKLQIALYDAYNGQHAEVQGAFHDVKQSVSALSSRVRIAQRMVPQETMPPAKSLRKLDVLVHALDILHHRATGKHVNRSNKGPTQFVQLAVKAADPSIRNSSIDGAIRRVRRGAITRKGRRGESVLI
jgi:hypothetical protein